MTLQTCTRCVMDTTATEITFDEQGICSFCHEFDKIAKPILDRACSKDGEEALMRVINRIREDGKGKRYDCVLGLSGGTDSSYLAYLAVELGLRPLAIHVDTGWNSEEAAQNIKRLVDRLDLNLKVVKVDWEEMRDLQLAFFKASLLNCDIPQDHAFLATLYRIAGEYHIRYILSGGNLATESILPRSWIYNAADLRHLSDVHQKYGTRPLRNFPTLSFFERYLYYPYVRGVREVRLLNFVCYEKERAKRLLGEKFGWRDYGYKHYESILTRFYQGYYLPTKFGIDKRKAHLSSLILSGQIAREAAVEELKKPPYPSQEQLEADKRYIAEKLGLSLAEWESILALPPQSHSNFVSSEMLFALKDRIVELLGVRRRRRYGIK